LFELTSLPDVASPEAFLSTATVLFADYAPQISEKAVPILATKSDRPTLRLMKEVLDELANADIERQRRQDGHRKALPHLTPRAKRTPEEQAKVDAQCTELRKAFGLKSPETNDSKTG
jgi:DNA-directed RNA polymerase subunit K/omega